MNISVATAHFAHYFRPIIWSNMLMERLAVLTHSGSYVLGVSRVFLRLFEDVFFLFLYFSHLAKLWHIVEFMALKTFSSEKVLAIQCLSALEIVGQIFYTPFCHEICAIFPQFSSSPCWYLWWLHSFTRVSPLSYPWSVLDGMWRLCSSVANRAVFDSSRHVKSRSTAIISFSTAVYLRNDADLVATRPEKVG